MNIEKKLRIRPGRTVDLDALSTDATPGCRSREEAEAELPAVLEKLRKLQYRLYADNRHALLVVLQAMDAGGKDGLVRAVFTGLNPQGCKVTSFKQPTSEELDHDFLWRIHQRVPPRGEIGVFNRSHYEDVLVVRVKKLAPREVWKARYGQIRDFEKMLVENGVAIVKIFLHISRKEQKERLLERLDNPDRNWKFDEGDLADRARWDAYQEAYEDVLRACSRREAPWYVVPADRKWYRNWAVARILLDTLESLKPAFPPPRGDVKELRRRLVSAP